MTFDGFWWQLDTIISSMRFDDVKMAANNVLLNVFYIPDLLGAGLSVTVSSKISQEMAKGDFLKAKLITKYITILGSIIGPLGFLVLMFANDLVAELFLTEANAKSELTVIMRVFAVTVPF